MQAGGEGRRAGPQVRRHAQVRGAAIAPMRIASVMPPQIARSGCSTSAARKSIRSRKSKRVQSLSPLAIGMCVERRTSARPRLSSAVTGSSNQASWQSRTR